MNRRRGYLWTRRLTQSHRQPSASNRVLYCGHSTQYSHLVPIVDTCLSYEDITRQFVRWYADGEFLAIFLDPAFPASRMQHISDLHPKFVLGPHHMSICRSMADIQSATAEIRRGKKER